MYDRDGYLIVRGLFSADEVAEVSAECDALILREELKGRDNLRVRWQYHFETGDPVFELFDPVTDIAPRCRDWCESERIQSIVSELVGAPVCSIKDKLIYKLPGSGGYPLHQDYIAWPTFPESFTTVVVAVDGADEENGCIRVHPGAHRNGYLSARDGNFHMLGDADVQGFPAQAIALGPGDALVFGAFMPHGSDVNRSSRARRHLLFSYNKRSEGELRRTHYDDFHHYLRSIYGAMGLGDMHFR
jgi:ectoine hydroxylase-related dioxygenase (phytanoyl-CoA dioxygenase family)